MNEGVRWLRPCFWARGRRIKRWPCAPWAVALALQAFAEGGLALGRPLAKAWALPLSMALVLPVDGVSGMKSPFQWKAIQRLFSKAGPAQKDQWSGSQRVVEGGISPPRLLSHQLPS